MPGLARRGVGDIAQALVSDAKWVNAFAAGSLEKRRFEANENRSVFGRRLE